MSVKNIIDCPSCEGLLSGIDKIIDCDICSQEICAGCSVQYLDMTVCRFCAEDEDQRAMESYQL
jgi:hypothetical protein